MVLETKRAREIDAYIKDHDAAKHEYHRVPVELSGRVSPLEVYRLPITLLQYNIRNGRFAAELIAKEKLIGHPLRADDPEDAEAIQKLLIELNPAETEALREDLARHGQMQPGIITHDGAVINANRRMAILAELKKQTGEEKYSYLLVARLPKSVSERDLWRIEAGIQFAKDFQLSYGPVNELLKLREGERQGLTHKEISNTLLGRFTSAQVKEKLSILKQIESYLHFINKPEQYDEIEGDVEKFNSLVKNVLESMHRQGSTAAERTALNMVGFNLIKSDSVSHWDIRKLKDVWQVERAKKKIEEVQNKADPAKTDLAALVDAFQTAREIAQDNKEREKPERLVRKALEALLTIDSKSALIKEPNVRSLLVEVETVIRALLLRAKK